MPVEYIYKCMLNSSQFILHRNFAFLKQTSIWTSSQVHMGKVSVRAFHLKVTSCKFYNNNKYMIALVQVTNNEIIAFITVLVFKLLSRSVLFINTKGNIKKWQLLKSRLLFKKKANFMGELL